MAGRRALAVCAAALGIIVSGAVAHAGTPEVWCEAAVDTQSGARVVRATQRTGKANIAAGYDGKQAWIDAEIRELGIRKFVTRRTPASPAAAQIELRYRGDTVVISLIGGAVTVGRGGTSIRVDSAAKFERLQALLAGSAAIFASRAALSDLEATSSLKGLEVTVLSSLAFAGSLVGDTSAPLRLTDRLMERHRGIYRFVRDDEASCWDTYVTEVNTAWNDLQTCMNDAADDGFISGATQRLACNAMWGARVVSAEFEYIKCISPLSGVPRPR
jgi:hypothetical protein